MLFEELLILLGLIELFLYYITTCAGPIEFTFSLSF